MRKTFQISGYGVNKRGHTVGLHYTLTATSEDKARSVVLSLATAAGYQHIRVTQVTEVHHA